MKIRSIMLVQDGTVIDVSHNGGLSSAETEISELYDGSLRRLAPEGVMWLHGKKGGDCIAQLNQAIGRFGPKSDDEKDHLIKRSTVRRFLMMLQSWAMQCPDATFNVANFN